MHHSSAFIISIAALLGYCATGNTQPITQTLTVEVQEGFQRRVMESRPSTNTQSIIVDRPELIAGGIHESATKSFNIIHSPPTGTDLKTTSLLTTTLNTKPVIQALESLETCHSRALVGLLIDSTDPEGDNLWHDWKVTSGSLLSHYTQVGENRFLAPYIKAGSTQEVTITVRVHDCYGATAETSKVIKVTGSSAPLAFQKLFRIDLPNPLSLDRGIQSMAFQGGRLVSADAKMGVFLWNFETRSVQQLPNYMLGNIMTDGGQLYGITRAGCLFWDGSPKNLSVMQGRKTRNEPVVRIAPSRTLYVLDGASRAVDTYQLTNKDVLPLASYYLNINDGQAVSGDWIYPDVWCWLMRDGRIFLSDFRNRRTREVQTHITPTDALVELRAGSGGNIAVRGNQGKTIYVGNVFDGKPFSMVETPLIDHKVEASCVLWQGNDLILGTSDPDGIGLLDLEKKSIRYLGDSLSGEIRQIGLTQDDFLILYDKSKQRLIKYDPWGLVLATISIPEDIKGDELDINADGIVGILNSKQKTAWTFDMSDPGKTKKQYDFPKEKPVAMTLGHKDLTILSGVSDQIPFSGERMMLVRQHSTEATNRIPSQIAQWQFNKKASSENLMIDRDETTLAAANNLNKQVLLFRIAGTRAADMQYFDFESLNLGKVTDVQCADGVAYLLNTYPTVEVVALDALNGRLLERYPVGGSMQEGVLAVGRGVMVVLDLETQTLHWYGLPQR